MTISLILLSSRMRLLLFSLLLLHPTNYGTIPVSCDIESRPLVYSSHFMGIQNVSGYRSAREASKFNRKALCILAAFKKITLIFSK